MQPQLLVKAGNTGVFKFFACCIWPAMRVPSMVAWIVF